MRRVESKCQGLQEESVQLARMLAEADLQRLAEAARQLPEDSSGLSRELQRKLQASQAQVGTALACIGVWSWCWMVRTSYIKQ
jgi:Skp family chaperone for outer membrane proteins